jgi:hypothetical protein
MKVIFDIITVDSDIIYVRGNEVANEVLHGQVDGSRECTWSIDNGKRHSFVRKTTHCVVIVSLLTDLSSTAI